MRQALYGLAITLFSSTYVSANDSTNIEHQRDLYLKAQDLLDEKSVAEYLSMRDQIADYPLTPYVDNRVFNLDIGKRSIDEVAAFKKSHHEFPFSSRIRANYLDGLVANNKWKTLSQYQTYEPRGETYQCYYYTGLLKQGQKSKAFKGAQSLWLKGNSVTDACDDLFEAWQQADLLSDDLILQRLALAFEARNSSMMNYLMKLPDGKQAKETASKYKKVFSLPESVGVFAKKEYVTKLNQDVAMLGFKKLARKSAEKAVEQYELVVQGQKLNETQRQSLAEYAAIRLMNTDSQSLIKWRDDVMAKSAQASIIERRIRLALRSADWQAVERWIQLLPTNENKGMRWQYWLARSEIELGRKSAGEQRLNSIIGKRHYYSVVAAQTLGVPVQFDIHKSSPDPKAINAFQPTLDRISELIALDKITAAKSEWRWLLVRANKEQIKALAHYASKKSWHHLTVKASIEAKVWDEIYLRFPVAHSWWFNFYGDKFEVEPLTLMSLARQESGLDSAARSPVGARGIMQIMPATAKYTAKRFKIDYDGPNELYSVQKNIEIGTQYLSSLLNQYDDNRIFAFAAYNAGPHRVKRWRKTTDEKLDAYAFIEAIPFNETRGYVQNVLMFESYYRHITAKPASFLTTNERSTKY